MIDATTKVFQAIQDAPRTYEELSLDTSLRDSALSNGLTNLLREGRIQVFFDNGDMMYRVAA